MTTLSAAQIRTSLLMLSLGVMLAGCFGGGGGGATRPSKESSRYSHSLHSQFYRAWQQPDSVSAPRGKVSVPVDVEIDQRGRVSRFRIAQSSGFPKIDASIRDVGRRVKQVEPPPGPIDGRFKLRIYFDLDVKR